MVTPPPVAVTNINSRRNMETMKIQRALLSVSDKTGLDKFAKGLVAQNVQLISTGGTCKYLQELGLPVTEISSTRTIRHSLPSR